MVFVSGTLDSTIDLLLCADGLDEEKDYLLPLHLVADDGTGTFELSKDYYYLVISSGLPRIVLEEEQVTSPFTYHGKDGAGIPGLIDDDLSTYWHSEYSGEEEYWAKRNETYGQYIDIALKEPIQVMSFSYSTRHNSDVCIQELTIYTSADGTNWTVLRKFEEEADNLPQDKGGTYTSDALESETSYSYIRFSVTKAGDRNIPEYFVNQAGEEKQSFFALGDLRFWGN